jgi:hypothetical protein
MRKFLCLAVAASLLNACSDPAANNEPASLAIEPGGPARTIRIGTQERLEAHLVNSDGRSVGTTAATWTSTDTSIVKVDANGELRLATSYTACNWVTPGLCQITIVARAGALRAQQLLTVMPFEPTVELATSEIDFETGDSARISAVAVLENRPVPWCTFSFTSADPAIARVDPSSGMVVGADIGSTVVHVSVTGALCPTGQAQVPVMTRPRLYVLDILPDTEDILNAGESLQLVALVTNRKDVQYPALSVQWSSSDSEVATVNNGLVRAGACPLTEGCRVMITARSGRLVANKAIVVH